MGKELVSLNWSCGTEIFWGVPPVGPHQVGVFVVRLGGAEVATVARVTPASRHTSRLHTLQPRVDTQNIHADLAITASIWYRDHVYTGVALTFSSPQLQLCWRERADRGAARDLELECVFVCF